MGPRGARFRVCLSIPSYHCHIPTQATAVLYTPVPYIQAGTELWVAQVRANNMQGLVVGPVFTRRQPRPCRYAGRGCLPYAMLLSLSWLPYGPTVANGSNVAGSENMCTIWSFASHQ